MPKYIVSQPAITLCIESRSSRSPTTTCAPISRNACARASSLRTIARTALPCFNSSSFTVRPTAPTRPAAPVTRMGLFIFLLPYLTRQLDIQPRVGPYRECLDDRLGDRVRVLIRSGSFRPVSGLPGEVLGNRGAGELLSE